MRSSYKPTGRTITRPSGPVRMDHDAGRSVVCGETAAAPSGRGLLQSHAGKSTAEARGTFPATTSIPCRRGMLEVGIESRRKPVALDLSR